MSILQDIYEDEYIPRAPVEDLPEDLRREKWTFLEEIEQAMGAAFIERHWDALCDLSRFRDYANFRVGSRGGGALWGAAWGPSQSKNPGGAPPPGTLFQVGWGCYQFSCFGFGLYCSSPVSI